MGGGEVGRTNYDVLMCQAKASAEDFSEEVGPVSLASAPTPLVRALLWSKRFFEVEIGL